jgi:hypothetical protein
VYILGPLVGSGKFENNLLKNVRNQFKVPRPAWFRVHRKTIDHIYPASPAKAGHGEVTPLRDFPGAGQEGESLIEYHDASGKAMRSPFKIRMNSLDRSVAVTLYILVQQ